MATPEHDHIFKRLGLRDRGHFPNTLRLSPVTQIVVGEKQILLTRAGKSFSYELNQIESAVISSRERYKMYGAGIGGKYVKRTFHLTTKDNVFAFDVSLDFPDFDDSEELERLLKKRLRVKELGVERFSYGPSIVFVLVLVVIWILLKVGGR
jgi:hypothetical protein